MFGIPYIVIGIICAYFCYKWAKKNGFSPILAAILGFFFSIIALIIYFIICKKK